MVGLATPLEKLMVKFAIRLFFIILKDLEEDDAQKRHTILSKINAVVGFNNQQYRKFENDHWTPL